MKKQEENPPKRDGYEDIKSFLREQREQINSMISEEEEIDAFPIDEDLRFLADEEEEADDGKDDFFPSDEEKKMEE